METLELKEIVCVFNQVMYVKAAEITLNHDEFYNIIIRMVAFHTIPSEISYIEHGEEVSGCWPPRLVCGVWRDFRTIHHCCDGRTHIQSYFTRSDVENSRLEVVVSALDTC